MAKKAAKKSTAQKNPDEPDEEIEEVENGDDEADEDETEDAPAPLITPPKERVTGEPVPPPAGSPPEPPTEITIKADGTVEEVK